MNTTPESVVTKYCSRRLAIFLHILFIVRNATIAALACYQGVQAEARGSSHVAPYVNRGAQELGGEQRTGGWKTALPSSLKLEG